MKRPYFDILVKANLKKCRILFFDFNYAQYGTKLTIE